MAERRMFAKSIVTSDDFLDMPMSARCLYFTLGMFADDDGFVNSPKSIMRQVGATSDDMNILLAKRYVIAFESGVIVIRHWRIHNYVRSDRYNETIHLEEKNQLTYSENGKVYEQPIEISTMDTKGIPMGYTGKVSIDKDSIGKGSVGKGKNKRFTPPSLTEVKEYVNEKGYQIDAEAFIDFYESKGWMVGKNKMKDWRAAVRNWARRDKPKEMPTSRDAFEVAMSRFMEGESDDKIGDFADS